jgi:hypothetical protein
VSLGGEPQIYRKRQLVPFGEYFPVPAFVRRWMRLMNLPYTDFAPGRPDPPPLRWPASRSRRPSATRMPSARSSACSFPEAELLVNVSNDAWFGDTRAPHQHLQIARLRAMETGRWMLRATNNGVTAVIDPRGRVVRRSRQFVPEVIEAEVTPMRGMTPWLRSATGRSRRWLGAVPAGGFAPQHGGAVILPGLICRDANHGPHLQAGSDRARRPAYWDEQRCFEANEDPSREKFYCLCMFPTQRDLHMGHVRNYTIGDVVSRYQRMRGKNVLQPMGWDAFGLPAENAAIKHGVPPGRWTRENIAHMRAQLRSLGFAYDWRRELATCDPGLLPLGAVVLPAPVREGPGLQGVVHGQLGPGRPDGAGQRAGHRRARLALRRAGGAARDPAVVPEDHRLRRRAARGLDKLPGWPEQVRTMQANWIGRSEGLELDFPLAGGPVAGYDALTVYTTRPDTLFGVTYMAVAAEHPLAVQAAGAGPSCRLPRRVPRAHTTEAALETMEKRGMPLGSTSSTR